MTNRERQILMQGIICGQTSVERGRSSARIDPYLVETSSAVPDERHALLLDEIAGEIDEAYFRRHGHPPTAERIRQQRQGAASAFAALFGSCPRISKAQVAALAIEVGHIAQGTRPSVLLDMNYAIEVCKMILDLQDTRRVIQEVFDDAECALGSKTIDTLGPLMPRDQ